MSLHSCLDAAMFPLPSSILLQPSPQAALVYSCIQGTQKSCKTEWSVMAEPISFLQVAVSLTTGQTVSAGVLQDGQCSESCSFPLTIILFRKPQLLIYLLFQVSVTLYLKSIGFLISYKLTVLNDMEITEITFHDSCQHLVFPCWPQGTGSFSIP